MMNQQAFNPGDVVQLKSGGPPMTVDQIDDFQGEIGVKCIWFEAKARKESVFPPHTLRRYEPVKVVF